MTKKDPQKEQVKTYYGQTLKSTADLQTDACCSTGEAPLPHFKPLLANLNDEITSRFYGCGSPIPPVLDGMTVLDLGCGTGRDVYLMSQLVGEQGSVIGLDMTDEQLDVAIRHVSSQTERFGYAKPNVRFQKGDIEDLKSAGIKDDSIDIIISNCVINLSPDKAAVFKEIFRVLKPGGELHFSDVFADRRIDPLLSKDPVLSGECLAGAMYINDFRRLLSAVGCADFRTVTRSPIAMTSDRITEKIGMTEFSSLTIRAFKLESLEDSAEDYGQIATYGGTITAAPHRFPLDLDHEFETHKPTPISGNTADMLQHTRLAPHFTVQGDKSRHFGEFSQPESRPKPAPITPPPTGGCC